MSEAEQIESTLELLNKTTTVTLGVSVALTVAALYGEKTIDLGVTEIPRQAGGVVAMGILCGVNLQVLRLLQILYGRVKRASPEGIEAVRTHPWIFNPFSETASPLSAVGDTLAFPILIMFWCVGVHVGRNLVQWGSVASSMEILVQVLYGGYIIFGVLSVGLVLLLLRITSQTWLRFWSKTILFLGVFVIGMFPLGRLVLPGGWPESQRLFLAAVRGGDVEGVRFWLGAGVPARTEEDGISGLEIAIGEGFPDVARVLLEAGADVNHVDLHGRTPLMIAAERDLPDVVRMLIEAGAQVDYQRDGSSTALMEAVQYSPESARVLLEAGASADRADRKGGTALMFAAENGECELVRDLLAREVDVNARRSAGQTALFMAIEWRGAIDTISLLLAHGADANAVVRGGATPLVRAIERGRPDIVNELLASGADPNQPTDDGRTPLMYAADRGDEDAVCLLIRYESATAVLDNRGRSASTWACNRPAVKRVLVSKDSCPSREALIAKYAHAEGCLG